MVDVAYRITIEGEFDEVTAGAFPDVEVRRGDGVTVLATGVVDQPALNGLLDRLRQVGAALVALERDARPLQH